MNRKNFITKSGVALGGGILAPYILPSGRLFAKSGSQKADHVVLVLPYSAESHHTIGAKEIALMKSWLHSKAVRDAISEPSAIPASFLSTE